MIKNLSTFSLLENCFILTLFQSFLLSISILYFPPFHNWTIAELSPDSYMPLIPFAQFYMLQYYTKLKYIFNLLLLWLHGSDHYYQKSIPTTFAYIYPNFF